MPLYEFQCQDCGEMQLVGTAPGVFEAEPEPCQYCSGVEFKKLVGSIAVTTEAGKARSARIDAALAKEEAASQGCGHCGSMPGMDDED